MSTLDIYLQMFEDIFTGTAIIFQKATIILIFYGKLMVKTRAAI